MALGGGGAWGGSALGRLLTVSVWLLFAITPAPAAPQKASRDASRDASQEDPTTDLVVFVAPGRSKVGRTFQDEILPRLRASAEAASMSLRVVNVGEGAPPEVTITPLLFHQSHAGRSVYQGRWNNLERLESFLETSRYVVQDSAPWIRADLPVAREGRALIAAPCKVTELTGDLPEGHDALAFEGEARAAIYAGFESFAVEPSIEFKRSDRAFYLDFYPYVAEGELYLSMALFSMFHCKEPLWRSEEPIRGPWVNRTELFARAARLGEEAIAAQRLAVESGDGFDVVPQGVVVKSWADLGSPLPPAPPVAERSGPALRIADLPLSWRFRVGDEESGRGSAIRFHFAPPLDSTAGEVGRAQGSFQFARAGGLAGAKGEARCETASVSLGWDDLDKTVHGESMLDVARFPEASFVLSELRPLGEESSLVFGRPLGVMASGSFTMKGREHPIEVRADIEPTMHASGKPRLTVEATFQLRLEEPFGITGPDGPSPAKDTLLFDLSLLLEPAPDPAAKEEERSGDDRAK